MEDFSTEFENIRTALAEAGDLLRELQQDDLVNNTYDSAITEALSSIDTADSEVDYVEREMPESVPDIDNIEGCLSDIESSIRYIRDEL